MPGIQERVSKIHGRITAESKRDKHSIGGNRSNAIENVCSQNMRIKKDQRQITFNQVTYHGQERNSARPKAILFACWCEAFLLERV